MDIVTAKKRVFRIVDSATGDLRDPYALLDDSDTVLRVSANRALLAFHAFNNGADEVSHDYDLVKAEGR